MLSPVAPGDVRAALPAHPPEHGEPFEPCCATSTDVILPGITHWQHPSFFAYFPANACGPAILGDLLASGLGVQGMLWATSPAATELETHVLDWLVELLDLPDRFRSTARRRRHPGHRLRRRRWSPCSPRCTAPAAARTERAGVAAGRFAVTRRAQTHSSVEKACRIAGLGADALRKLDVDAATLAARPEHLRELIAADRAAGVVPALRRRVGRRHRHRRRRPGRRAGGDRARGRARGCTSTPPGPASPRSRRSSAGSTTAWTRRLLRHQPAQVAADQLRLRRVLGRRPRARCSAPCRSCPSTCATPPPSPAR